MQEQPDPLLEVNDLCTHFVSREGTLKAVDGVSFTLPHGSILGLVGESGCGKSVTAQSILRIVPRNGRIARGNVRFRRNGEVLDLTSLDPRGKVIRGIRGKDIAMIFQEPMTSLSPVYTIGNQIMEVFRLHQGMKKQAAREASIAVLRQVGMPRPESQIDAYPFSLSGGMRQRAMIAMALACQPSLMIADEPTTALDVTIQAQIMKLLLSLRRELGLSILLITHDLGLVAQMCDRICIMYLGWIVEAADAKELFDAPRHPYTRALLHSIPTVGRNAKRDLQPISGSVPSLYELPSGCSFNPRCPSAIAGRCDREPPPLVQVGNGHSVKCWLAVEGDSA